MSLFLESENSLNFLKTLDKETLAAPPERLTSPSALRGIYDKLKDDDSNSAYNRSLIQGLMDFTPPHDDFELENKGQSDRFNITTGEGPAIKNEAVAAYMDIYTTPKVLAEIPLLPEIDKNSADTWGLIMAEEYTTMDRSDDASLPLHLQLADTYVTHGVAIGYFDDRQTMRYSTAGLDHFKFPRKTGIVSSEVEMCCALGSYGITELYSKIVDIQQDDEEGWNSEAVKRAILNTTSIHNPDWNNWEEIQRQIKSNDIYVSSICDQIEVVHGWVREFNGKISYYIAAKQNLSKDDNEPEENFLFRSRNFYESVDEAFQIFPFSVGNGGRLYTVRGLGYLIYQLCNAMDIMHCKMLDNARVSSSLIVQPASTEDLQDMQLIDFGSGIAIPPNMKLPERQISQNLNNSLIPALNESRNILNRATGGLANGDLIQNPGSDRRTKLEVSSQLDHLNKLNSFAINLFYGPYDKITREKVRRAFTVRQKDKAAKKRVDEMKKRCVDRGVPPDVFDKIDFKRVRASRIIGTGSRSSRIMLMDQMQQMYSTWDAVGRNNFEYDYLVELVGAEKAERYAGKPEAPRQPVDASIAKLENFQLLEGDYMDPIDGQNHMVHLGIHIEELQAGLQGVDEGQIDIMQWTMEHQMLFKHCVATLEVTTVHESVQDELNAYHQQIQQIGEIITNGIKMINKKAREGQPVEQGQQGQKESPEQIKQRETQAEMQKSDMLFKQKMEQDMQKHMLTLQQIKEVGQQKMVMSAQNAMSKIVSKDAEVQARMDRLKQSQI